MNKTLRGVARVKYNTIRERIALIEQSIWLSIKSGLKGKYNSFLSKRESIKQDLDRLLRK